ncbi:MAG: hydroxymethylbilane synthase [Armatimonadota bacterium]
MRDKLVLATRGSRLALAQSGWVRDELCRRNPGLQVQLLLVKTTGDKVLDVPLQEVGGKGLFTKEIEEALLEGRADLAVHSLKDLPTELPEGLALAALTERADPRDVLVCRAATGLDRLLQGALVGTSSLRRSAQLAHHRPDLHFAPIRGNVETRLAKLMRGEFDAIVLAAAGLLRLGLADRITQTLSTAMSLPAAGQGIIGLETRSDDEATIALLQSINSSTSQTCAAAERAALGRLGGGCHTPIGVLAQVEGDICSIEGVLIHPSGNPCYRASARGLTTEAEAIGWSLAEELLAQGADLLSS